MGKRKGKKTGRIDNSNKSQQATTRVLELNMRLHSVPLFRPVKEQTERQGATPSNIVTINKNSLICTSCVQFLPHLAPSSPSPVRRASISR